MQADTWGAMCWMYKPRAKGDEDTITALLPFDDVVKLHVRDRRPRREFLPAGDSSCPSAVHIYFASTLPASKTSAILARYGCCNIYKEDKLVYISSLTRMHSYSHRIST